MIKDTDGNELTYWPISGLVEGESSAVLTFIVEHSGTGKLSANEDPRGIIWARRLGDVTYIDIASDPIDMSGIPAGDVSFQCYLEALVPISGLERVPFSVVAGVSSPAGWAI